MTSLIEGEQSVTFVVVNNLFKDQYHPFIGEAYGRRRPASCDSRGFHAWNHCRRSSWSIPPPGR